MSFQVRLIQFSLTSCQKVVELHKPVPAKLFSLFLSQCFYLIPLKTSENFWFSDVFEGDQKGAFGRKGLGTFELFEPLLVHFFLAFLI